VRIVIACLGFALLAHSVAADYQTLAPGLDYRHDVRANGPLSIHMLRMDRIEHRWELHADLGQGTVFGLEPLDGIVRRASSQASKAAVAAINGDFFVMGKGPYQGDPRGIQIANGELVSGPTGNSFWVSATGELRIGPVTSKLRVIWPDGKTETRLGLNEARSDNEAVLFTPTLGIRPGGSPRRSAGTRTQGGRELVLESVTGTPRLPIVVGKCYRLQVYEIREAGDTPLSPNRLILSVGPNLVTKMPPVQRGDVVQVAIETSPDLRDVKTAIGCGRILMENGKLPRLGPPSQPRHPRSMLGWNDRYQFFIVVDGRQKASIGMTYPEMSALVKEYGCTNAAELDGGGSSTLWATGKILNSPSDGRPRPIANGLILFRGGDETSCLRQLQALLRRPGGVGKTAQARGRMAGSTSQARGDHAPLPEAPAQPSPRGSGTAG
jgi:hypothetical protein